MSHNSAVKFFILTRELERKFIHELSVMRIMVTNNKGAKITYTGAFISIILAAIAPIYSMINGVRADEYWPLIVCLSLSAFALFLLQLSIWLSHSFIKYKYPEYSPLFKKKKILFNYDYEFIFAYRCEQILEVFKEEDFKKLDIDELINFFSDKSTSIKSRRWTPITIISLIMFPLWSEFIGAKIGQGWEMFVVLLALSIFASYVVILVNNILRMNLLSQARKYDDLVGVLKIVKSVSKNNT
ncbi:hypothetical protein C161_27563 [Paenibacillus sp. FSL R5-192]|uniref:hypothetical protein n=1 Tax=Paenibacillus sp. FSL R5-192 TaxID=1226754 RepID=UPI0003E225CC|nr:hypothetical protein [Paenibacillus sp. FSL R5-192]ETT30286.1 hypothetical protein C161_27563 [Paenibacillus sp. FSL R5-192]